MQVYEYRIARTVMSDRHLPVVPSFYRTLDEKQGLIFYPRVGNTAKNDGAAFCLFFALPV